MTATPVSDRTRPELSRTTMCHGEPGSDGVVAIVTRLRPRIDTPPLSSMRAVTPSARTAGWAAPAATDAPRAPALAGSTSGGAK